MIRISLAGEPEDFDAKVRQPGLRAINELIGAPSDRKRGRKLKKVATRKDEIPPENFPPYWREAKDDLLSCYKRICSYLSLYIPRGTGAPSTDHVIPKSKRWDLVYEWRNYRLACALMNSRKGPFSDMLDPVEIEDHWFQLDLVAFQLIPNGDLSPEITARIKATICRLRLNDQACCEARAAYAEEYWKGHISLDCLTRHAPFVARELRRQNCLKISETPPNGNQAGMPGSA